MKVALVFTGLLRRFEDTYPAWKSYVLDRYDTHVYFDIWDEVGYYTGVKAYLQKPEDEFVKIAEGDRGFHDSQEAIDGKRIIELYHPLALNVQNFSEAEHIFDDLAKATPNAYTRPKNTIAMFYKIARGMQWTLEKPFNYDLVIRARPDLLLTNDPGMFSPDWFYTIQHSNKRGQGTGDSIQVGSPDNMLKFSHVFQYIPQYYQQLGVSCPHLYTAYAIQQLGLEPIHTHIPSGFKTVHSQVGDSYTEPVS